MVNKQSHDMDKPVTWLPVLVSAAGERPDGDVIFQEGRVTTFQPVKRFVPNQPQTETRSKRFLGISKMYALASGKKIDYSLLQQGFRSLVEDAFGQFLADQISATGFKNPKPWSSRWLPAIFNHETKPARVVMWWPEDEAVFGPAIYCPDPGTALFVSLLFSGIRACLGCGRTFTPEQPNQLYHDRKCGDRHRKRRERSGRR